MAPEELLQGLRDIQLPESVPFWPPAPGWWLLALLLAASLSCGFFTLYRRRALRREALGELRRLAKDYRREGEIR